MIESIKIRDFRGIKEGEIEQFKKINLLVGPNNSGKSAVLEAIYLACANSREAGLIIDEYGSANFFATIAERDLLGDHPMQRILAKHNYSVRLEELSDSEPGFIKVNRESLKITLSKFDLSGFGKLPKGDESLTATFGLELEDKGEADDRKLIAEIQQRIVSLMKDAEPLEDRKKEVDEKTNMLERKEGKERNSEDEELIQEYDKEMGDIDIKLSPIHSEQQELKQEVSSIERRLSERQKDIKSLSYHLMLKPIDSFERSRLIYCWHRLLSHFYKGDAAWVVKGEIPTAQNTLFYDLSKVTGHIPLELFQQQFIEKPNLLRNIAESFRSIFEPDKEITIQFLPSPENENFLQAWIAPANQNPVPIDGYGDGARSVFKLLVALHILIDSVDDENPGIVFWEEPELFQNPKTLGRLLREVVRLINQKNVQIFIASHSMEVSAHFVDLVRQERLGEDKLLVLRTRMLRGELLSVGFDHSDVEAWISMRKDLRVPSGDADSPLTYQMEEFDNEFNED